MTEKIINKAFVKIKNIHGDNLNTDLRYISGGKKLPIVIFCHGFKGFKDWGCFPYMMDKIASENNFCVSFNFSYNGTGDKENEQSEFTRLDLFAKNTFTRELDDLGSVIDFLFENKNDYSYDTDNVTLIGHSRGGGVAILKTAEDKRVTKLIVLASVNNFDRYTDSLKKKWKEAGYLEVLNSRTNQMMRQNYSLIEDLEKNFPRLDIQKAITVITTPLLLIHGTQDISVDYSNAEDLYVRHTENNEPAKERTELILIENTGHTFGAVHPFEGTTKALEEVITFILDFQKKNF
ncbi:MAG TPA: prolyl oligopeptidase family serine peptidase [Ignavibacteria bacterium]|nr:prolyl oligopeptidase family serine peptidase [Ignavibacteria bacterium]